MSALRAALTLLGVVPIVTGLGSVLFGSGVIPGPNPSPSVESELRFYAAWWVGGGLVLLWIARRPAERGIALRGLCAVLFLGGLARLLAAAQVGWPRPLFVVLMAIELVLPLVLVPWQARVATN